MPDIKKNSWEYLNLKTTKIPEHIRNSSDPKVIIEFLSQHGNTLSDKERANLNHRIASLEKINSSINTVKKQVADGVYQPVKADVLSMDDIGLYTISGISQPSFQTGDFGCWSCFYNLALQSRGIRNLTQEDIRAYRPAKIGNDAYSIDSDKEMNTDVPLNMMDMGDLALNLLPDTMVRSTEIWSYKKYKGDAPLDPEEKEKYSNAVISAVKQQIITAIRDYGSPVGLMMDGHYITITGIEGDIVSYKDSMPNDKAGNDPDYTYQKNINTLLDKALNGENADTLMINWLEDIKLSKEGNIIYNMPAPNITAGADGKLIVNTKESQAMFRDDRHQTGTVIGTTGGIDIADADSMYRTHLTNGFMKNEKVLLPRELNLVSLRNKAKERSNEEEAVLAAARNKRIEDQKNLEKDIADRKVNAPAIDPAWMEVKIPRYKVPVQYTGKPFFGGGNLVDFKNLLNSFGWDRKKYDTLLGALSNLYSALPGPEGSVQRQAMDVLFTKCFVGEQEYPGTVRELKNNLTEFKNYIQNGGTIWDDLGNSFVLTGISRKKISVDAHFSFRYLTAFIDVLSEIEKKNPNLKANQLDIDSFIDVDGYVRMDAIRNDPIINPELKANKNAAKAANASKAAKPQNDARGRSISPKCKYRFYDLGETKKTARNKLFELDKLPNAEKDPNLVFSLILVNAYWKLTEEYDAIHLSENDFAYLKNRYETDPDFAKTMEDMVEYGYGKNMWDNLDLLTPYIYHAKSYEIHEKDQYEREHSGDNADKILTISKRNQTMAASQMRLHLEICKNGKASMHHKEITITSKDKKTVTDAFNLLKEDLRRGNHSYESVTYAKNPKIDYIGTARMMVRSQEKNIVLYSNDTVNQQIESRNDAINKKADAIANDLNFVMYIQENKDRIPAMTVNEFANGYTIFKNAALTADTQTGISFQRFGLDSASVYSANLIKNGCKNYIRETKGRNQPFNRIEIMEAADLVIANMLTAKAADAAVFSKVDLGYKNGVLDEKKLKSTIKDMRTELLSSPEFLQTLARKVSPADFYSEYKKELNRNVNKTIKDEYARNKAVSKTNRAERTRINKFLRENVQEISAKQAKEIVTAYENLLEYNKGKDPSDRMEKLMNALEAVVEEIGTGAGKKQVHMNKLTNLNKYTMKYYDHRQGLIFSPITDDGKSRLAAVERLSKVTNQISKKMAKDHPEIKPGYKAPSAPRAGK